jgi:hypothetical protein
LSDISLNFGLAGYALFALVISWPGIAVGAPCGAIVWRTHRVWGGVLGAIVGAGVCLGGFAVWVNSDLSLTLGFTDSALLALEHGLPGLIAGAAVGAWLWRSRRTFGAVCGALAGVALSLSAWRYFNGTL